MQKKKIKRYTFFIPKIINSVSLLTEKPFNGSLKHHNQLYNILNGVIVVIIACSRRSDSGERCEVKGARKNKSEGGGEVREGTPHLSPQPPSTFHPFLYFAPLSTI